MRRRRSGTLEIVSISALDIFASALGAFMLLTIAMMPYWLREPALEQDRAGAEAELAAAGRSLEQAERLAAELRAQASAERTALEAAEAARAEAATTLAEAEAAAAEIPQTAEVPPPPRPSASSPGAIRIEPLDLVFVMDTTGSMRPALADVQASLLGVVRVLARLSPSLRVAFVAYRDRGEAYLTRQTQLLPVASANLAPLLDFVQGLEADGGGDDPEAIDAGLDVALALPWRADAVGRIVVVGDSPVHASRTTLVLRQAAGFRNTGGERFPRTVSAIFTGDDPLNADAFARLAEVGGGDFTQYQGQMIESILLSVLGQEKAS